jgi:hypothetical protein
MSKRGSDDVEAVFRRTTSPTLIMLGARESRMPPPLPRTVLDVAARGKTIANLHQVVTGNAVRLGGFRDGAQSIGMRANEDKHAQRVVVSCIDYGRTITDPTVRVST